MAEELTKEEQQKQAAEAQKKAKEEFIKKIVLADDYEEEHYKKYGIQDLVFARNSAKYTAENGTVDEKAKEFMKKRGEFLDGIVTKRIAEHQELLKSPSFKDTDYAGLPLQDIAALANGAKQVKENALKQENPDENFVKFITAKEQFYRLLHSKKTLDEQNTRLLVSSDFDETHYEKVSLQQLMLIKGSAKATAAKQAEKENTDPKLVEFFKKREEFFNFLIMKKLPKEEKIWCVYTKQTQMPFLTCDEETGNDQAWIYTAENIAKLSMERTLQKKEYPYEIKAIENKEFINFYVGLLAMGVNEVVVDPGAASYTFELEKFVKKPDFSKTVINQSLLLTGIYFSQEQRYGEEHKNAEKLEELFEEIKADIIRGELFLGGILPDGEEKPALADLKCPIIQGKDGERYQLVYTDVTEIVKYATVAKKKFQPIPVNGEKLITGIKKTSDAESDNSTSGLIINPGSVAITLKIR